MIIEAKSTRQNEEPGESRKRFEFKTMERLSKLPLYLALFAVGIATYLKTAFEGRALAQAPQPDPVASEPETAPPVNWCLPGVDPAGMAALDQLIDDTTTGSIGDEAGPRNQIGRNQHSWPGEFLVPESPAIQFTKVLEPVSPAIAAFFPPAFGYSPSNDNFFPGGPVGPGPDDEGPFENDKDPEADEDDDGDDNEAANRAPTVSGPVRLNDVFAGQVVLIGLTQLLLGASDPDGDPLSIMNLSVTGTTVVRSQNGWTLATQPGMLGPVTFTYQITDGETAITQTASLQIIRNGQVLTEGDDVHAGTDYDDDIDALAGDDLVDARGGNDLVVGGAGDDNIVGGDGDDHLYGNAGDDTIVGGNGNDLIHGGAGDDRLFGDAGNDIIHGDADNDSIWGGIGNDLLDGGDGADAVSGDAGNDALRGGHGNDVLSGGIGDDALMGEDGCDTLDGGTGNDALSGGAGNDAVQGGAGDDVVLGDTGDDSIDGGEGHDRLDMSEACEDLLVDFTSGTVSGQAMGEDHFESIEQVSTGSGDDMFILGATATVTSGGRGRDTFIFEVTDDDPTLSEDVVHDILDFVVGDRIRVRDYDIDRDARNNERDLFREIYEDDDDDWLKSDLPIIVRHERYDDVDQTIIMADIDRDNVYEITINIHGIHLPIVNDPNIA